MNLYHYSIIAAAILIPVIAYFKKALTLFASVIAVIMVLVAFTAGEKYALFLLLSFLLISVIDKIFKKKLQYTDDNLTQKTGTTDAIQVLVNGGVALVSVLLWHITGADILLMCFTASLIESFGDSAASSIGIALGKRTLDICRLDSIETGLSGGVTVAGTVGCFISCMLMSMIAYFLDIANTYATVISLTLAAFIGCMIDSVLGSLVQRKERCVVCEIITEKDYHCGVPTVYYSGCKWINNDVVNLLSNIISTMVLFVFV